MRTSEVMVKDVISIQKDLSVYEAVKLMNKNRIGCLVVVEDGQKVVGVLTERDVLKRVLEEGKNPKETKVSKIMTRHVIVGTPNMQLAEATELMFLKKIKKLPIVKGNRLVGLITLTDIARIARLDEKTMELIETRTRFLEAFISSFCMPRSPLEE